ncbi:flagellar protein FlgN [Pseudarthrobacter sp. NBSH8]|uniref:flagellar protein FlgN n=1 Tax=Pseudarthrobacter sp. NBSH8 TaxID=2596911 RepID=UPI001629F94A|nr:flagellar protein FlgN [Pseudarthrobacter sp. NBSH8]QNE15602.1 flagellar protein FlgN [Pseudarthrobacter sp. NBSH8]
MGAEELSASLWRERRGLELLLFRLETQLLYLNADQFQWLAFTSADLESAVENLRFETLARNVEASAVAAQWGAPPQATLPHLAATAPTDVWGALLQEHHSELSVLVGQVNSAREANIGALRAALEGSARDAEAAGMSPEPADELAVHARHVASERALAVVQECGQPLVKEFLGLD